VILLDTHALVWLLEDDPRLGPRARRAIERASGTRAVAVSASSFWELALLAERKRVRLRSSAEAFRAEVLAVGLVEVPIDGDIAILSTRLALHRDPADRLIIATALARKATLLTADAALLAMKDGPRRLDASQ